MKKLLSSVVILASLLWSGAAFAKKQSSPEKFPGLARTPPMGWNSWNRFGCDVDERKVKQAADAMAKSGMKQAGYRYVVIDDCWQGTRDKNGFIRPDKRRFPGGMKALADYVHSKGLKFGLYSDAGWKTCGGRPGSRGYEYQDALTYARWGVDYLKYDWCNTDNLNAQGAFQTMGRALRNAKRPIVFSICEWGNQKPWEWGKSIGQLWRTTGDITDCFDCVIDHGTWKSWGIMPILDKQEGLRKHAGPDHWNDPDMMEVGNGMSVAEDRSHFSMWAMLAAPLVAGNDLATMTEATRRILTNSEVIAVDQDKLGIQGYRYLKQGELDVWVKPLVGNGLAVAFLNRGKVAIDIDFDWQEQIIKDDLNGKRYEFKKSRYAIRDLWAKKSLGTTAKSLKRKLASHDTLILRLRRLK